MELDFDTVKALSSKTRIKILNETVSNESTPTDLSNSVGKSKSTVSSHLEKLQKAGLLEKDKVEGRRRVVYKPTDKAKAIINGRDRKVKFSILSTVSTAWIGLGLTANALKNFRTAQSTSDSGGQMGKMALNRGVEATTKSGSTGLEFELILFAGIAFLSFSILGLAYGFLISRIRG